MVRFISAIIALSFFSVLSAMEHDAESDVSSPPVSPRWRISASYFKHFRQEGKPIEIIVYYDQNGDFLYSVKVTPLMTDSYHHYLESIDQKNPRVSYKKRGCGCVVSYSKYHDIIGIKKYNKTRPAQKILQPMDDKEIERLFMEAQLVVHSSLYDAQAQQMLARLKNQAKK